MKMSQADFKVPAYHLSDDFAIPCWKSMKVCRPHCRRVLKPADYSDTLTGTAANVAALLHDRSLQIGFFPLLR